MINVEYANETKEKIIELSEIKKLVKYAVKYMKLDNVEFGIIFVNNKRIREINKEYRNIDRETDVITFRLADYEEALSYFFPFFLPPFRSLARLCSGITGCKEVNFFRSSIASRFRYRVPPYAIEISPVSSDTTIVILSDTSLIPTAARCLVPSALFRSMRSVSGR